VPYGYIGNYQATYWNINGSLSNSGNLGSDDYRSRTLGSATGYVTHNTDGTKSVSFSGSFNPTAWYQIIEVSGSATLPNLHKPPEIESITLTENNQQLIDLSVDEAKITQYLSNKTFAITSPTYDSATITNYSIYHNNILIGTSNGGDVTINFYDVGKLITTNIEGIDYVTLLITATDSLNGYTTRLFNFEVYLYDKPTYDGVKTNILRKSDYNTSLIDNYALLNFYGNFYKNATDPIGLHNSCVVEYKIWQDGTTEPVNYITLQTTIIDNQVKVEDYLLSNIDFLTIYNYKIRITDTFDSTGSIKESTVPLGVATWTEFADRVDFLKLTVQDYNPFEYSEDETICGVWNDGYDEKTLYRKVIDIGSLPNASSTTTSHNISDIEMIVNIHGVAIRSVDNDTLPIPYVTFNTNNAGGIMVYVNSTNVVVNTTTDRSAYDGYIILEYTKT